MIHKNKFLPRLVLTLILLVAMGYPMPVLAGNNIWTLSSQGMYGGDILALALSPNFAADNTLFVGTSSGGVFKSTDGGANWAAINTGLTNLDVQALTLSPDFAADHTLFAGTSGFSVWQYTFAATFPIYLPAVFRNWSAVSGHGSTPFR
jgi:hypothetical protein